MDEKKEFVLVEAIGARKHIGKNTFIKRAGYEYPVCEMPRERAEQIINNDGLMEVAANENLAEKNKYLKERGRNLRFKNESQFVNFRYAVPVNKETKKVGM